MENQILYHDEILTNSVMMATNQYNNYQLWLKRYNQHEKELGILIEKTKKMLTELNYNVLPILKTSSANQELIAIEKRAFDMIKRKDFASARNLLLGKEYLKYKKLYYSEVSSLTRNTKELSSTLLKKSRQYISYIEKFSLICAFILIIIWIYTIFSIKSWLNQTDYLLRKLRINKKNLKASIEGLKEKNDELKRFNFVIAHDLKESLRSIYSFSQLLERSVTNSDAKDYLARIQNSCFSIKKLTSDLLSYAKLNETKPYFVEVNLENIIHTICRESLNELITSKKAIIKYDNLPIINSDPIKLSQIFYNLITNGIIYNKSNQPTIKISCQIEDGYWIIAVEDNGIGINEEYYDKVFELFTRLNDKRFHNGTGLGLAICKKTIVKIEGKIWIDKSSDYGTTFKISLPYTK